MRRRRAGWTGRRPGTWCLPGIRLPAVDAGGVRAHTESPETATSGQSPHVSYGYTKLDPLPSRVPIRIRRSCTPDGHIFGSPVRRLSRDHGRADSSVMDRTRHSEELPPLALRLLVAGIPPSLLVDLMSPGGPDSEAIARYETAPAR